MLTKDYLNSIFEYKDGNLYYKERIGKMLAGQKAGSLRESGYIAIVVNKVPRYAHRFNFYDAPWVFSKIYRPY